MTKTVLGLDVSKTSATYSLLSDVPNDPKNWAKANRPRKIEVSEDGREELLAQKFDFVVLEPTGVYSRIWRYWLREADRPYKLVGHQELRSYREGWKIASKTDRLDAVALAMYGVERDDNRAVWLCERDFYLSDLMALHNHLNRQKNGFQNYLRQHLNWQHPEMYKVYLKRSWGAKSPPKRLKAIAGQGNGKWAAELSTTYGPGIDDSTQSLAKILLAIEEEEIRTETRITEELKLEKYQPYLRACSTCKFSDWSTAVIIAQSYPFERFLDANGKRIQRHQRTENGGRIRRDISLRSFKLACGVGQLDVSSGDWIGKVASGPRNTRCNLYSFVSGQWLLAKRQEKRGKETPKKLRCIKHKFDRKGTMKAVRKYVEDLYDALVHEFNA